MTTNARPLSAHATAELQEIAREPVPYCGINAGVIRKLVGEGLAEIVDLPSPFKVHKGGNTRHLRITQAGRDRLNSPVRNPATK